MQAFIVVVVVVVVRAAAAVFVVVVVLFYSRFNPFHALTMSAKCCPSSLRDDAQRPSSIPVSREFVRETRYEKRQLKKIKKKKKKLRRRRRRRRRRSIFWTAERFLEGNSTSNAELLAVTGLKSTASLTAVVPQT